MLQFEQEQKKVTCKVEEDDEKEGEQREGKGSTEGVKMVRGTGIPFPLHPQVMILQ